MTHLSNVWYSVTRGRQELPIVPLIVTFYKLYIVIFENDCISICYLINPKIVRD